GYLFANGPTAVADLASSLHLPFTYAGDADSLGKGLNFAVAGAQTGCALGYRVRPVLSNCGVDEGIFGRGMQNQVSDFVHMVNAGAIHVSPESTLFFIAGGLNDGALTTAVTAANLKSLIQEIYNAGGRYFLLALLP